MKKLVVSFVFVILFLGSTGASNLTFEQMECQSLMDHKSTIIGSEIPEKIPFTNEIVNIYFSESIYGNIEIENKKIKNLDCIEHPDATYNLFIEKDEVLFDLMQSSNIIDSVNEKISNGEIKIEGTGFSEKVKVFFVKIGIKVISWFN